MAKGTRAPLRMELLRVAKAETITATATKAPPAWPKTRAAVAAATLSEAAISIGFRM